MLKDLKKDLENFTINFFKEVFGEDYKIEYQWGIPISTIIITLEKDSQKSIWKITFEIDSEEKNFSLTTFGSRVENEKTVPEQNTIESNLIYFIIEKCREITNSAFKSNPEKEETEEKEENKE